MAKKDIKENALAVQDGQLVSLTEIQARIYMVRGVQVMLDRDSSLTAALRAGRFFCFWAKAETIPNVRTISNKNIKDFLLFTIHY